MSELTVRSAIKGTIQAHDSIIGEIYGKGEIHSQITVPMVVPIGEAYEGPYEVTPDTGHKIILPTENKLLAQNVTVYKVPYYETSNDHGTTVYIGEL